MILSIKYMVYLWFTIDNVDSFILRKLNKVAPCQSTNHIPQYPCYYKPANHINEIESPDQLLANKKRAAIVLAHGTPLIQQNIGMERKTM